MAKGNAINVSGASAVLLTDETGALAASSTMTDGQVIIGSTGGTPVATTLTAGSGISITPGAGTISIAATGGGASGNLLNVQYLTTSGTYTATAGTVSCLVQAVGGGGGGGGMPFVSGTGIVAASSGGGGGAWAQRYYATAPSSASFTIGALGSGGASGANPGSAGGSTSFNGDFTTGGGSGGIAGVAFNANTRGVSYQQTLGGSPSGTYDVGGRGGMSVSAVIHAGADFISGSGGDSVFGDGAIGVVSAANGIASTTLGSGGSGCGAANPGGPHSGGNGAPGIIIVYEYGA